MNETQIEVEWGMYDGNRYVESAFESCEPKSSVYPWPLDSTWFVDRCDKVLQEYTDGFDQQVVAEYHNYDFGSNSQITQTFAQAAINSAYSSAHWSAFSCSWGEFSWLLHNTTSGYAFDYCVIAPGVGRH